MATRNRINNLERQASWLWQQLIGKKLASTHQEQLTVIYPGRMSGDEGPDFQDAVILRKSRLTRGDVEVHVKSSDWYGHQHHADAAYNNVILHAVLWHDSSAATLTRSGQTIPVLCLTQALNHQPYLLPPQLPCSHILDKMEAPTLIGLLAAAGQQRFGQKANQFQGQMQREDPGQVLFRGMMRALGYAKNTKPFEELAATMPLSSLEGRRGLAAKQALLLATAGLLPSQSKQAEFFSTREIRELEQIWRREGKTIRPMAQQSWNFSHIYPNNSPVRRLIALSYLLERYRREGLLAGLLRLVKEAPSTHSRRALHDGLTVVGNSYWRSHLDFGMPAKARTASLLGASKADEIVVNVILPFGYAWGKLANDLKLTQNAIELFVTYPGLAENYLTRHMRDQLGIQEGPAPTACHQQGLIHIFKNNCCEGKCSACPLAT